MQTALQLEAEIKGSFKVFLGYIWTHLRLPPPTPIQNDIADYLQYGSKRIIIEAFRGVGKSYITSAFVVWNLLRDPDMKIMVVSASKERSDSFSQFTKRLISEVPWLKFLTATQNQRNSMISFDVAPAMNDHSPSVKSVGITGQLTGSRADLIIADDIEVLNNSATQTAREKLLNLITEFDAILKPLPSSRIIYLGTPQTMESIYNILPTRGYRPRIWPALFPTPEEEDQYEGKLAPYVSELLRNGTGTSGNTTDPARFNMADLEERRLSYGKAGFALQFMLNTALSDAEKFPLKLSDLIVMDIDKERGHPEISWMRSRELEIQDLPNVGLTGDRFYVPAWKHKDMIPFTGTVMAIDPSGRGKDETAYAVLKMLNGHLYLVDCGGIGGGYEDKAMREIVRLSKMYDVNEIVIESNFGDGMFGKLLEPHLGRSGRPVTLSEVRQTSMKEARIIDTLEPVMMQHRLIVDRKLVEKDLETAKSVDYSLFYQMTRICNERGALSHDDRLDALAMAVAYWVEQMNTRSEELERDRQSELSKALVNSFLNGLINPEGETESYNMHGRVVGQRTRFDNSANSLSWIT